MALKDKVLEATGRPATQPQIGYLKGLTGLQFWSPENQPPPNGQQASLLIDACLKFIETKANGDELIDAIQIWFPSFDDLSEIKVRKFQRWGKRRNNDQHHDDDNHGNNETPKQSGNGGAKSKGKGRSTTKAKGKNGHAAMPERDEKGHFLPKNHEPETVPEPPQPEPKPEPKPLPKPKPQTVVKVGDSDYIDRIIRKIDAGLRNLWLVGPAGCGKTTMAKIVAEKLGIDYTIISCGAGTMASTFLGYKYPEREGTDFSMAYGQPGIIVLDEFTSLEPDVAQVTNAALANGFLNATTGKVKRHPDCIIIATSNTYGLGGDRVYVANNQLDGATIDRFPLGFIEVDYDRNYERANNDSEVCEYVWRLRDVVSRNGLRRIVSTRIIEAATLTKQAGDEWKNEITVNWSKDEKALIQHLN